MARIQGLLSFLLVSVGTIIPLFFGLVPLSNFLTTSSLDPILFHFFWWPFFFTCIFAGYVIDRIKNRKYFCLSLVIWGFLEIFLIFLRIISYLIIIFILLGIFAGFNIIFGTSYMNSNISVNRRGVNAGIFIAIGWAFNGIISLPLK